MTGVAPEVYAAMENKALASRFAVDGDGVTVRSLNRLAAIVIADVMGMRQVWCVMVSYF